MEAALRTASHTTCMSSKPSSTGAMASVGRGEGMQRREEVFGQHPHVVSEDEQSDSVLGGTMNALQHCIVCVSEMKPGLTIISSTL